MSLLRHFDTEKRTQENVSEDAVKMLPGFFGGGSESVLIHRSFFLAYCIFLLSLQPSPPTPSCSANEEGTHGLDVDTVELSGARCASNTPPPKAHVDLFS